MAPLLGAAVFSAALGGLPAALRALAGYLVYGATLGGIVGAPATKDRETARPRRAGPREADTGGTPRQARSCWARRSVTGFQGVSFLVE
jgi:hypothetical protein